MERRSFVRSAGLAGILAAGAWMRPTFKRFAYGMALAGLAVAGLGPFARISCVRGGTPGRAHLRARGQPDRDLPHDQFFVIIGRIRGRVRPRARRSDLRRFR